MTVIYPEATSVQGNTKIRLVTTIANTAAPSLAGEVNAASSLDVSCFIVGNWTPELTVNTGNAPARLCTTVELPVEGRTQLAPITVEYVYDPQAASTTDDNKALAFLTRGTEFFAVVRRGLDARTDAFTASEYVETWKFRAGRQNKVPTGDDEFAIYVVRQQWFPLVEPVDGQIAA